MILRNFMYFNDNTTIPSNDSLNYDVYYKVQPTLTHLSDFFKKYFVPSRGLYGILMKA